MRGEVWTAGEEEMRRTGEKEGVRGEASSGMQEERRGGEEENRRRTGGDRSGVQEENRWMRGLGEKSLTWCCFPTCRQCQLMMTEVDQLTSITCSYCGFNTNSFL